MIFSPLFSCYRLSQNVGFNLKRLQMNSKKKVVWYGNAEKSDVKVLSAKPFPSKDEESRCFV